VLDARPLDPGRKVVPDLIPVGPSEFPAEEGGHVSRLHGMDGRMGQGFIERLELGLAMEDDIGGVLHLHAAPVDPGREVPQHGAVGCGNPIEVPVEPVRIPGVRQGLGPHPIGALDEGVVEQGVRDLPLRQLPGEHGVPVAVELEPERRPGGHSEVAEPQFPVDEVEVVMEALGLGGPEERLPAPLVVPRLERRTRLHRREDVHQAGMVPAGGEQLLDPVLLAEGLAPDELDREPVRCRQPLRVGAELLAKRLGESRVVEQADLPRPQKARHRVRMAEIGERPGEHHPVEAGEDSADLAGVSVREG